MVFLTVFIHSAHHSYLHDECDRIGYSRETPLRFSDNALTLRLNAFVEFMNVVGVV